MVVIVRTKLIEEPVKDHLIPRRFRRSFSKKRSISHLLLLKRRDGVEAPKREKEKRLKRES